MNEGLIIRAAVRADAAQISAVITETLYVSNKPDYGEANVARVAGHFTPDKVAALVAERRYFVASLGAQIVGVVSLNITGPSSGTVGAFFVLPDQQGKGVGKALLGTVEGAARALSGTMALVLHASVAGEQFYLSQGYIAHGDVWDGTERTIRMTKTL